MMRDEGGRQGALPSHRLSRQQEQRTLWVSQGSQGNQGSRGTQQAHAPSIQHPASSTRHPAPSSQHAGSCRQAWSSRPSRGPGGDHRHGLADPPRAEGPLLLSWPHPGAGVGTGTGHQAACSDGALMAHADGRKARTQAVAAYADATCDAHLRRSHAEVGESRPRVSFQNTVACRHGRQTPRRPWWAKPYSPTAQRRAAP